ncbi:MAG TPA: phospholipase D-like domain-containing protein [Candidatus Polarisedimenticolaceae bacterium]|nr:phospholipase D-like domain-containing protein [Candidatus Polarisedimenticolaceae bacterium]
MKAIVQPESGLAPVVAALRKARESIDICIFRLDRKEVEDALGAAVTRGVKVRALIANVNSGGRGNLRKLEQRLLEAGVMVIRTSDDLVRYHGKYMIVDKTLYVFGFNFTEIDVARSRSFAIATRDLKAVKEASRLFEADATRQPYEPSGSNLVVSPETAREVLGTFLRGARKELAIYDLKIQDPAMIRILEERAKRGVKIRVIGGMKGSIDGVAVQPLSGFRLHVRAIIRDGTRAFVGSQSLRTLELDKRRELGLLISNPAVTRQLLAVFEADWGVREEKKAAS